MFILIILFLTSCTQNQPIPLSSAWQTINSRDEGIPSSRYPLYRAKVPTDWKRVDPIATESIADTMKPLCEFYIDEEIRLTVHSFPTYAIQQRTPPYAQIQRWRNQFEDLNPTLTSVTTESRGGFVGLFLEGEGIFHENPTKILGWSMQLAPEYYHQLSAEDHFANRQKKSDYTIKVLGPPTQVDKHRDSIIQFANTFELIDELAL